MCLLMHRVGRFCKGLYVIGLFDNTLASKFFQAEHSQGAPPPTAAVSACMIPKTELAVAPGGCF